ncbi:SDR family oxidoreductase [Deefgea sp. CFH1-16]|uniref:SDR family NAD(P)-dependent oxidoreductase n=1 Tax=Deefgea sp. CFH1-16 TaxID=2675457 RepID=UPI0015F5B7D0|nr:SDR family NAD(P)-dependent oxidoreductase [Deefgea sp. CFH1-16]MBM5574144.1 SDR family NAD(P)-dependent oxidoreductase [Deefgea sp. CFH1-16]
MHQSDYIPQSILITGATGAIGGALALAYAASGVRLILLGQRADRLEAVAQACREQGASVLPVVLDCRDIDALQAWAARCLVNDVPDLLIANAGVNINVSDTAEGELWADMQRLFEVNVLATLALVNAFLPAMRQRGSGQIALVSSLAAYFGLPMTPSYSASKAAIKAYGEGLRALLADEGIAVNVIMPGYVTSPMCEAMPGPKPWQWSPERAAAYIQHGLQRNRARISFPFPLNWGSWWLAVLPAALSQRVLRWIGYRV